MKYIFDIETDGLLDDVTQIHCIVLKDINTNEMLLLRKEDALNKLSKAELIVGHNTIKFDIPVIKKLYPAFDFKGKIFDTLVATRLLFPDVKEKIFNVKIFLEIVLEDIV